MFTNDPVYNAIQKTIESIPIQILRETFKQHNKDNYFVDPSINTPVIVENEIYKHIICKTITRDCNIHGGKLKKCALLQEMRIATEQRESDRFFRQSTSSVYRIPAIEREDKPIIGVVAIKRRNINNIETPYNMLGGSSVMADYARSALGAQSFQDSYVAPTPEIAGYDLIRLITPYVNHIDWVIEFEIPYTDNFNNLNRNAVPHLMDMVLYATQHFVHNNLVIAIDAAAMRSGVPLGSIRDIIYEYKESIDKYKEALELFTGAQNYDVRKHMSLLQHFL